MTEDSAREKRAIEARLAELDAEDLERERQALLAELGAGTPVSDDQERRVLSLASADLLRAERLPEGARTLAHRAILAAMLEAAEITDHDPLTWMVTGDVVSVRSASRGRVDLGQWDPALAAELERELLIRARTARRGSRRRPGPPPATTPQAVARARRELEAEGRPSGEKAIGERLGVSRGAVRHAEGKDRRRGP
jgi:hypothetical protein